MTFITGKNNILFVVSERKKETTVAASYNHQKETRTEHSENKLCMEVLQEDIRIRGGNKDVVGAFGDEDLDEGTEAYGVNAVVVGHKDIRPGLH